MAQRDSCKIKYHHKCANPASVELYGVMNCEITCYVPFHNENRHRLGFYSVKYIRQDHKSVVVCFYPKQSLWCWMKKERMTLKSSCSKSIWSITGLICRVNGKVFLILKMWHSRWTNWSKRSDYYRWVSKLLSLS